MKLVEKYGNQSWDIVTAELGLKEMQQEECLNRWIELTKNMNSSESELSEREYSND